MIGMGQLEPVSQGNKYEIVEIEDCARSLGFFDIPGIKPKLESLSGKLIKVAKDGFFILELCDGTCDNIYGTNAWLSWENKFPDNIRSSLKGQLLVSAFNSGFNFRNVGIKTFKEMLRSLDMIDGKCGNYGSEYYINNWYHAALMESL